MCVMSSLAAGDVRSLWLMTVWRRKRLVAATDDYFLIRLSAEICLRFPKARGDVCRWFFWMNGFTVWALKFQKMVRKGLSVSQKRKLAYPYSVLCPEPKDIQPTVREKQRKAADLCPLDSATTTFFSFLPYRSCSRLIYCQLIDCYDSKRAPAAWIKII